MSHALEGARLQPCHKHPHYRIGFSPWGECARAVASERETPTTTQTLSSRPKHRASAMRSGETCSAFALALPGLAAGFSPRSTSSIANRALAPALPRSISPKVGRIGVCLFFCHSLRESASSFACAFAFALVSHNHASALAVASEIGPGFSPDISKTPAKGFSPWGMPSPTEAITP